MTPWMPTCVCRCGRPLQSKGWRCLWCRHDYDAGDGILRWLSDARREAVAPFLSQYRHVRQQDGYRVQAPDYYRALPVVPAHDPQFAVWQVRRESFVRLRRLLLSRFHDAAPSVLDLGAGNGWLSARLAEAGCRPVAVDLLDDACDGLGACRHQPIAFPRVLADFDDLPFAPRQFDVVVFNGSLHYAPDPDATLSRAATLLTRGGMLAVVDSPIADSIQAGEAMRARVSQRLRRDYGVAAPVNPGQGYVTLSQLAQAARMLGWTPHFFESRGPARWALGRAWSRVWRGQQPARFGVWMAS